MQKNIKLRNLKVTEEALAKISKISKSYEIPKYDCVDILVEIFSRHEDELGKVLKKRFKENLKKSFDEFEKKIQKVKNEPKSEANNNQEKIQISVQSEPKNELLSAQRNESTDTEIDFLKGKIERNELISEKEQEVLLGHGLCPKCGKKIEVLETYMRCTCGYSCNGSPDSPRVHNKYKDGIKRWSNFGLDDK